MNGAACKACEARGAPSQQSLSQSNRKLLTEKLTRQVPAPARVLVARRVGGLTMCDYSPEVPSSGGEYFLTGLKDSN